MADMLEKIKDALAKYAGAKLAVGVSGGRDSMCLLHALTVDGCADGCKIIVVHVNHCLRETAVRDENFVREYCDKNGIECRTFRVDVEGESKEKGATIEQAARSLRYGIFLDLVKSGEADIVLTAHHALDNAESVLMHLFRGSGLDGLRSMSSPNIVRPLIDVYPVELDEYAQKNGIEFVTDETNFDDAADRNFIRLNVIPLVEQRYKGAVRAVNNLSRECDTTCEFLDGALDTSLVFDSFGAVCIADAALKSPIAARYVRHALKRFTLTDMTRDMVNSVISLLSARMGATAELAHGVRATREYGSVALYIPRLECETLTALELGANFIDGLRVQVDLRDADPKSVRGGVVDFDKIVGAKLRFRRDGDTFVPLGGARKNLNRFFIDGKIPKRLRDRIPLVCKGDEVLVVCGMQIADSVKITDGTRRTAVITVR